MANQVQSSSAPGRTALRLVSTAPKRLMLGALAGEPLRPGDLADSLMISSPTLYRHLPELEELGLVEKHTVNSAPYAVEYSLTVAGRELTEIASRVEAWLRDRTPLPLDPASQSAWRAATALGEGWATSIVQRLADRSRSEAELTGEAVGLSHYEICGRLNRLVSGGVLERIVVARGGGRRHYGLSDWGRRGVGLLAIAARWEGRRFSLQSAGSGVEDGVAALLVALPLIQPASQLDGVCELRLRERRGNAEPRDGAVWVEVRGGLCLRCGLGDPPRAPGAWIDGSLPDWLAAVIDSRRGDLRRGGDQKLANGVLSQLHRQLYG